MNGTEFVTERCPVVLRDDGGPRELLADTLREATPDEWSCVVTWRIAADSATVAGLELLAPRGEVITPTRWRWVRVGEVVEHSRVTLELVGALGALVEGNDSAAARLGRAVSDNGRAGHDPEHFETLARIYNRAVATGDKYPVRAARQGIAEVLGYAPSDNTVRGWIRVCKRRGLITKTARGSRSPRKPGRKETK